MNLLKRFSAMSMLLVLFLLKPAESGMEQRLNVQLLYGRDFSPDYDNVNPNEIKFFSYDSQHDGWRVIPSQIDEVGTDGFYYSNPPNSLSSSDEILFMVRDAGDFAPMSAWIPIGSSQTFARFQIELSDTTGEKKYIYAFRVPEQTVADDTTDYIRYKFNSTTNLDSIYSRYYTCGFNKEGLWTGLSIPTVAGGNSGDFIDRLKVHAQVDGKYGALSLSNFTVSEDFIKKNSASRYIDGKIRVIRTWETKIDFGISFFPTFPLPALTMRYYPYYNDFSFTFPTKLGGSGVEVTRIDLVRLSVDMDPGQSNMRMFAEKDLSLHPTGVAIDQNYEDVIRDLNMNGWNWWMQTGSAGSLLSVAYLQPVLNVNALLYYQDDAIGTNDGPGIDLGDTGGGGSWGDTGIQYRGMTPNSQQTGNVTFAFRFYFLGANISPDSARQLRNQTAKNVSVLISAQNSAVPVELAAFSAMSKEDRIILDWRTASETNNLGFGVERKKTASEWQSVGFVKGHGTISSPRQYRFEDQDLAIGKYHYRLKQIDTDGSFHYSPVVQVQITAPKEMILAQNYPNPFNPRTTISYRLAEKTGAMITLSVIDLLGRTVRTLVNEPGQPGYYRIEWDGSDDGGRPTGSGVYFYLLTDGQNRILRKMIKVQ